MWLCRTRVPPSGRSGTWALACPMLHDPKSPHHVGSNPHVWLRAQPGGPQATEGCFANLLPLRTVPSGSGLCLASLAASTWGLRGPRPTAPDFTAHLGAEWSESRERSGGWGSPWGPQRLSERTCPLPPRFDFLPSLTAVTEPLGV